MSSCKSLLLSNAKQYPNKDLIQLGVEPGNFEPKDKLLHAFLFDVQFILQETSFSLHFAPSETIDVTTTHRHASVAVAC